MARLITTTPDDLLSWNPQELNLRALYAAAEHAIGAYAGATAYVQAAISAGFEGASLREHRGVQVAAAWAPGVVVIAPPGSVELRDWWDDIQSAWRRPWDAMKGGMVGRGFLAQSRIVDRLAFAELAREEDGVSLSAGRRIIVVGHSLGAATSEMLGWALEQAAFVRGARDVIVATFEGPRWCDAATAAKYDSVGPITWPVVNTSGGHQDPVTRFHLKAWGFRHVAGDRRVMLAEKDGRPTIFRGREPWQQHRDENPTPWYRPVTRLVTRGRHKVRAHLGQYLLEEMRERLP